jgi:WD40 repeat protein
VKEIGTGHSRKINSFTISINGNIWSAGDDGAICVWDCEVSTFITLKLILIL